MADVANGWARSNAWPGAPLREVQQRQGALCRGALLERGASPLQGAQYTSGKPRVCRRSIFDRRHCYLALDLTFRMANHRHEAVPKREALVRNHCRAPGSPEGLQDTEGHGPCADAVMPGPTATHGRKLLIRTTGEY